jgi:diacylglycerol O-acyltransferase / wax synthase
MVVLRPEPPMHVMPLVDALFLQAEARERPMHVGGLQLFRPPEGSGPEHVGERYRSVLEHTDVHPRLRRRPTRPAGVGPWGWEDDPDLDLEYHVRHSALPHPGRVRELLALVSRLHGTLLDRSRALWEMHLIEGLEDGRFGVYTKIHHALVDGVSAMRMLQRALSEDPDERDLPPPWAARTGARPAAVVAEPGGGPLQAVGGAARGAARGAVEGIRAVTGSSEAAIRSVFRSLSDEAAVLPYQAPRSMLNVPISGARRFAADSWELDRVAGVRQATGATLNDVVMAMCAGALRRYLLDLAALPDEPLVAMVPVSLRADGDADTEAAGNAVGVVLCNLGTHLADPQARFGVVRESMRLGKLGLQGLSTSGVLLLSALSFAPLALGPLFRYKPLRKPPFNLIISNVPGPRTPLYYDGARLEGVYPLSIPIDGQALNITVTTYVDHLEVGLTGCRRSMPHLQRMLDHLEASLVELEQIAGAL